MRFDHVIVGGGVVGTCAAYHLSAQRRDILLVERGKSLAPRNPTSSSGDATKCFRTMYGGDRNMTRLAKASLEWWQRFQEESGERFFTPCGLVAFGARGDDALALWRNSAMARCVQDSVPVMEAEGVPFEVLGAAELSERFPQIQATAACDHAMLDKTAGILGAAQAVKAIGSLAERNGAEIWTDVSVTGIVRDGDSAVRLATTRGDVEIGRSLILAAGYTNPAFAPELRRKTRVSRQQVIYFKPGQTELYRPERLPIVIDLNRWRYALPLMDGVVKVADDDNHVAEEFVDPHAPVDPVADGWFERDARDFLRDHIPGLLDAPVADGRACLYTNTVSEQYLIYRRGNCVVVSACSGHGFKNGPITGLVAARLACGQECDWYFEAFRYEHAADVAVDAVSPHAC